MHFRSVALAFRVASAWSCHWTPTSLLSLSGSDSKEDNNNWPLTNNNNKSWMIFFKEASSLSWIARRRRMTKLFEAKFRKRLLSRRSVCCLYKIPTRLVILCTVLCLSFCAWDILPFPQNSHNKIILCCCSCNIIYFPSFFYL